MIKSQKAVQEVRYTSLPSVEDLKQAQARNGQFTNDENPQIRRYEQVLWRLQYHQRKAAVIAAEVVRPQDMRGPKQDYRVACQMAREKYEQAALAVFSEVCTKGL